MDKDLIHVLERIANGIAHNEAQSSLFGNLFGEPKGQEN